ncbi:MAG: hypothetical protein JRH15_14465 [Deltaproteobacteria bacterium]|nr:hypothetical protein [Deltaproteobacteria bacterium]
MAKIIKRKLKWVASTSPQVIGYKLYWSENSRVSYDSPCAMLGNVTEITLPGDVESFIVNGGPVEFAITAVDELGNESDMMTLMAPYQFNVPQAPEDMVMEKVDGSHITCEPDEDDDFFLTNFPDEAFDAEEPIKLVENKINQTEKIQTIKR